MGIALCLIGGSLIVGCGATFRSNELPDLIEQEQPKMTPWGDLVSTELVASQPRQLGPAETERIQYAFPDIDFREGASVSRYTYTSARDRTYQVYVATYWMPRRRLEMLSAYASFFTLGLVPGYYQERGLYDFFVIRDDGLVSRYSYQDRLINRVGIWGLLFGSGENFYLFGISGRVRPTMFDRARANVFMHFLRDIRAEEADLGGIRAPDDNVNVR